MRDGGGGGASDDDHKHCDTSGHGVVVVIVGYTTQLFIQQTAAPSLAPCDSMTRHFHVSAKAVVVVLVVAKTT